MAVRLQFTEEELAGPKLKKAAHKAQRRTDKLDKAEKKLPKKTVRKPVRTVDPQTGKVKTTLQFAEVTKKPPSSKLTQTAAADAALAKLHHEAREAGEDNSGVEAANTLTQAAEGGVALSTYPSEDSEMLAAEAAYAGMETELQSYLDTYESTHDYDEYHYDLDSIEHDPYVLISYITAYLGGEWTMTEAQPVLDMLFEKQYILTETVTTETRTRTVTNADGEDETEEYTYYICTVTLENFNLSHVPVYTMSQNQLSMYAMYMAALGNRPDLFPGSDYVNLYGTDYERYEIPPDALEDEQFAAFGRLPSP